MSYFWVLRVLATILMVLEFQRMVLSKKPHLKKIMAMLERSIETFDSDTKLKGWIVRRESSQWLNVKLY
jgi:hypothetical protein